MNTEKFPLLVWIDIETSGLNPVEDLLLAVGSIITTPELKVLAEFEQYVCIWMKPANVVPIVDEMHINSGVWNLCLKSRNLESDVISDFSHFIGSNLGSTYQGYLAGNSVHFDRNFLEYHGFRPRRLPLHYRHLDVSFFKVMDAVGGPLGWPILVQDKTEPAHTPLADLRHAIEEYRFRMESTATR